MIAGRSPIVHITRATRGFTLVELLVVIGIIAILIGIMLPSIVVARRQSLMTRCAANIDQICLAIHNYCADWRGSYPPNVNSLNPNYWFDDDRVGPYLSAPIDTGTGRGGGVLKCPEDDGAVRSYSMNVYASSKVDNSTQNRLQQKTLWNHCTQSSQVMLVVEAWSALGSANPGYYTPPTIGSAGATAGNRFGAGTGISPGVNENLLRFGTQLTELAFGRHPVAGGAHAPNNKPLPGERLNFGYADGHVAAKCEAELADVGSGISTLDTLWSPLDYLAP
jgi:prepilin-type N-terminal cleavage/methylation domain-containing protein/prepilin-type processing-associated H-X9-DG protein